MGHGRRGLFALVLALAILLALPAALARQALAEPAAGSGEARPSVLVVDANTGDLEALGYAWLGPNAEPVATTSGYVLLSCADPVWWEQGDGQGEAPATFVLGCDAGGALGTDGIAWALDALAATGAEQRSFVIAMGPAGLRLREYAEGLGKPSQAARADIVGLAFCGVPQLGYQALATYPELALWDALAASAGLATGDLEPESDYLAQLNSHVLPAVSKTLSISGMVGDLGFGAGDGAGALSDFALSPAVTEQVMQAQATATVGQALGLSRLWLPFASEIDYPGRAVDHDLAERLSAMTPYVTSHEVQAHAVAFYDSWFASGAPVTHNSSVLAIDLSGSMLDAIEPNVTKLDAAKTAAVEYLHAMQAVDELPQAAPMDVQVLGFDETLTRLATSFDDAACKSVLAMSAAPYAETNIGIALDEALSVLVAAPTCAKRHVLLLSDGATTRGKTNEAMMSTTVEVAKGQGIAIDVVGFGDVGESNAAFLRQLSAATGGTYYEARDSFELRTNFLKVYYASLGLELVDEELAAGTKTFDGVGEADDRTSALQVGIVSEGAAPAVRLLRDGVEVDADGYEVRQHDGFVSIQCASPLGGSYSLELSGGEGRLHVFAVRQLGIGKGRAVDGEKLDLAFVLLIATLVALVVGLVAAIAFTNRRAHRSA